MQLQNNWDKHIETCGGCKLREMIRFLVRVGEAHKKHIFRKSEHIFGVQDENGAKIYLVKNSKDGKTLDVAPIDITQKELDEYELGPRGAGYRLDLLDRAKELIGGLE